MGYYTSYSLKTSDNNAEFHKQEIGRIAEYKSVFEETAKWYDHDRDMKYYSKKYPKVIFTLLGEGEDSENLWVKYYKNGKVQHEFAIITYPEFNELKLI